MKLNKTIFPVIIASSLLFTACKCDKAQVVAPIANQELEEDEIPTTPARIDADGNYIYDVGNTMEIELPDGRKISVGENSTENRVFLMLNDPNFNVLEDRTQGWFTLDRVYFTSGSAELTNNSENQINNLIQVLEAFPSAIIKLGGYTDSTGDDATNLRVSTERAKVVAKKFLDAGIDASRVEHEGYGAQHFVCQANDTDECKAQNRRVDLRIMKK